MSNADSKQINAKRSQAVAAALASVRTEGLQPSASAAERLNQYAAGKISAAQLQKATLNDIRNRSKA